MIAPCESEATCRVPYHRPGRRRTMAPRESATLLVGTDFPCITILSSSDATEVDPCHVFRGPREVRIDDEGPGPHSVNLPNRPRLGKFARMCALVGGGPGER